MPEPALVELLHLLRLADYKFTTVTPATHARVLALEPAGPPGLRDIFGWNRPFTGNDLDPKLLSLLERADMVAAGPDGSLVSRIRVASLDDQLFIHSAYPTTGRDAVFFGPDTYRFARFLKQQLATVRSFTRVIDMGAGSGAGGIAVARYCGAPQVTLIDINPVALRFAAVNAAAAGVAAELVQSDQLPQNAGLVIANPPYIMDPAGRDYRDGGGLMGGAVALEWVRQALGRAGPGMTMVLYTGAAFVEGRSPLLDALSEKCAAAGATMLVEEIDPDVFGEELASAAYRGVERIAAVGVRIMCQ